MDIEPVLPVVEKGTFNHWTTLKGQYSFCFWLLGIWDLNSLTKNESAHAEAQNLATGSPGKSEVAFS